MINLTLQARFAQRVGSLVVLFLCVFQMLLPFASADEPTGSGFLKEDAPLDLGEEPDLLPNSLGVIARLLGGFLFLLLMMGGGIVLLKRWARPVRAGERPISLIFEEPIGQKRSICLVRVGEQVLVVGVTPSNISYLTRMDDTDLVDSLQSLSPQDLSFRKGWSSLMGKLGRKQ